MKRFILTGTPGSGKTTILLQLELDGFSVVEEAATDLIAASQAGGVAEPWTHPSFIDAVLNLQKQRLFRASQVPADVQFHDRSAICTAALAAYLGYPASETLSRELRRIQSEQIFQKEVFFIRDLGFIAPTDARRISFQQSLRFEQIHEQTYRSVGFEIVYIESGKLADRVAAITQTLRRLLLGGSDISK